RLARRWQRCTWPLSSPSSASTSTCTPKWAITRPVCSGPRSPPSSSSSRRDSRLAARTARSSWTFSMRQLWRRVRWRLAMAFPMGGEAAASLARARLALTPSCWYNGAMFKKLLIRYPVLLALLAQLGSLLGVAVGLLVLAWLGGWRPRQMQAALAQGLLAAALGRWLGLRRWWLVLNRAFVPGLLILQGHQWPAWWFLAAFVLLLLVN